MMIAEAFGPTIQGEGPHAGRLAYFVRVAGCNLACAWCDTSYARERKGREMTPQEVADMVPESAPRAIVVVTGGEPTIYDDLPATIGRLYATGHEVHLETNGTRFMPLPRTHHVSISPKLWTLTTPYMAELDKWVHRQRNVDLKFVVETEADADNAVSTAIALGQPSEHVWLMPKGATRQEQTAAMKDVAEWAIARGVNFSPRLHVLCWDTRRGV